MYSAGCFVGVLLLRCVGWPPTLMRNEPTVRISMVSVDDLLTVRYLLIFYESARLLNQRLPGTIAAIMSTARAVSAILSDAGCTDHDGRVVSQLVDFATRYVTDVVGIRVCE